MFNEIVLGLIMGILLSGIPCLVLGYYAYHYFCRTQDAETLNVELMDRIQELKDYINTNGLI